MSSAQPCLTQVGWNDLVAEMGDPSSIPDLIVTRKLNSTASIKSISIVKEGHDGSALNRYVWRLKVPISIAFCRRKSRRIRIWMRESASFAHENGNYISSIFRSHLQIFVIIALINN